MNALIHTPISRVTIRDSQSLVIASPCLLSDFPNAYFKQFLRRSFELEEVVSIEVDFTRYEVIIRMRPKLQTIKKTLRRLAETITQPLSKLEKSAPHNHFILTESDTRVCFAKAPTQLKGLSRVAYQGAGYGFLGLSCIGAVSPFLPTTPFVLLSSYFFVRSSPELNKRLLKNRFFGPILEDWYLYNAMTPSRRRHLLVVVVSVLSITILAAGPGSTVLPFMLLASLSSATFILLIPVTDDLSLQSTRRTLWSRIKPLQLLSAPQAETSPTSIE